MARKLFKKFIPDHKKLQENRSLKIFGKFLLDQNLWQLNRYSAATACSIGLFITFLPFPGHMIIATLCAIFLRANLPISILLVWVVNPFTILPLFGFAYSLGAKILHISWRDLHFESFAVLNEIWQPLLLGCLLCGTSLAILGNLSVRLLWRCLVSKHWRQRQSQRRRSQTNHVISDLS